MSTKIRLQRHGRKGYAYYHIVVADSRAPRDGKFIERLGSYNPNTNPATIDLNFDRALYWVQTGAQPTDTTKNILSREGVLMKSHLLGGVKKGAFTLEDADTKFEAWKQSKESAINAIRSNVKDVAREAVKKQLDVEKAYTKAKEEEIAKKQAELRVAAAAAKAEAAAPVVEAKVESLPIEAEVEAAPAVEATVEVEAAPAVEAVVEAEAEAVVEAAPAVEAEVEAAPVVEAEVEAAPAAEEEKAPAAE